MATLHVLALDCLLGLVVAQGQSMTNAAGAPTPAWVPSQGFPRGAGGPSPGFPAGAGGPPYGFPLGTGGPHHGFPRGAGGPPPGFPFAGAGSPSQGAGGPPADLLKNCPPEPTTVANFNVSAYLGKWYEQKAVPSWFQPNSSCVRALYGLNNEGQVTVYNVGTKADGEFEDIRGTAVVPNPATPAKLIVTFPRGFPGNYNVLDTDYTSYAVVYSCPLAWVLTREPMPPKELIQKGVEILTSKGVDISKLKDTVQNENCKYDVWRDV
jgi:apolipoprotein D and lipocalin family protein